MEKSKTHEQQEMNFHMLKDEIIQNIELVLKKHDVTVNIWVNALMYLLVESLIDSVDDYEELKKELINVSKHMAQNAKTIYEKRKNNGSR